MATDGGLRQIFQSHLPDADIVSVETWSTGRGVPDFNYCLQGCEGWIEAKVTAGMAVGIRPEQVAWIERRCRVGGRVLIAIRRTTLAGPRKGPASDALWLYGGHSVRALHDVGLKHQDRLGYWAGSPAKWDWAEIRKIMMSSK